jgi:hypothetical protein
MQHPHYSYSKEQHQSPLPAQHHHRTAQHLIQSQTAFAGRLILAPATAAAAAAYWPALQAPTNASASASANANSAVYKYSTCLQTSSALSPSLLAPLFNRPGPGPGTPGRLLYLRCDPQLAPRCNSPSHVRILTASCPHSPSPTEVAASIVSSWWCPTTTALRDADPGLLGKPNTRYW